MSSVESSSRFRDNCATLYHKIRRHHYSSFMVTPSRRPFPPSHVEAQNGKNETTSVEIAMHLSTPYVLTFSYYKITLTVDCNHGFQ